MTAAWGQWTWLIKPHLDSLMGIWDGWEDLVDVPPITILCDDVNVDLPDIRDNPYDITMNVLPPGWREDNFSDRLRDELLDTAEPIIFWTTPDSFFVDRVGGFRLDGRMIKLLADYMVWQGNVVRMTLGHIPSLELHRKTLGTLDRATYCGLELVECSDLEHCSLVAGVSMGPGLLNRKLLLELLEPGWKLWDVETHATAKMLRNHPGWTSQAIYPGPGLVDVCCRGELRDMSPLPEWLKCALCEAMPT